MLQLMNRKEDELPVLMFGTEQCLSILFDSQVILCQVSKTLRMPITRYCLRSSGFKLRTVDFSVKS